MITYILTLCWGETNSTLRPRAVWVKTKMLKAGMRDLTFLKVIIVMKKVNPQITDEGQGK